MNKQSRSEARRMAFTQIFQMDLHREDMEYIMDELISAVPECESNLGYIRKVVDGVRGKEDELEELIKAHLKKGWSLSRISRMSLAILKLAIYEIKYVDDVPPKAAINEAVELAKQYGAEGDPSFVNGLLGAIYKEL